MAANARRIHNFFGAGMDHIGRFAWESNTARVRIANDRPMFCYPQNTSRGGDQDDNDTCLHLGSCVIRTRARASRACGEFGSIPNARWYQDRASSFQPPPSYWLPISRADCA